MAAYARFHLGWLDLTRQRSEDRQGGEDVVSLLIRPRNPRARQALVLPRFPCLAAGLSDRPEARIRTGPHASVVRLGELALDLPQQASMLDAGSRRERRVVRCLAHRLKGVGGDHQAVLQGVSQWASWKDMDWASS
jgi:hypothetical protein